MVSYTNRFDGVIITKCGNVGSAKCFMRYICVLEAKHQIDRITCNNNKQTVSDQREIRILLKTSHLSVWLE